MDETEDLIRRANVAKHAPADGLWEVQFPAPSVPVATSEAAADALTFTEKGKNSRAKQLLTVLALICSRPSAYTIDEIDEVTGMGSGSICARISDLRTMGFIVTSTITRQTRRGKAAAVQQGTDKGRARLALETGHSA